MSNELTLKEAYNKGLADAAKLAAKRRLPDCSGQYYSGYDRAASLIYEEITEQIK